MSRDADADGNSDCDLDRNSDPLSVEHTDQHASAGRWELYGIGRVRV